MKKIKKSLIISIFIFIFSTQTASVFATSQNSASSSNTDSSTQLANAYVLHKNANKTKKSKTKKSKTKAKKTCTTVGFWKYCIDSKTNKCTTEKAKTPKTKKHKDAAKKQEANVKNICKKRNAANPKPPSTTPSTTNTPGTTTATKTPTFTGQCDYFLGLTSWSCGVDISDQASLKNGIWQIVANVAADITVIAAYLILGFVIYGGYLYMFSAGDSGKVEKGKKTLTHAFIGLAIVLLANAIMSTIRYILGGRLDGGGSPEAIVSEAINWFIGVAGVVSVIFIVYGGISYMISRGDPGKVQKAKHTILYALIGLAIVALSIAISAFVSNTIDNAKKASQINQTTISKEVHEINQTI